MVSCVDGAGASCDAFASRCALRRRCGDTDNFVRIPACPSGLVVTPVAAVHHQVMIAMQYEVITVVLAILPPVAGVVCTLESEDPRASGGPRHVRQNTIWLGHLGVLMLVQCLDDLVDALDPQDCCGESINCLVDHENDLDGSSTPFVHEHTLDSLDGLTIGLHIEKVHELGCGVGLHTEVHPVGSDLDGLTL